MKKLVILFLVMVSFGAFAQNASFAYQIKNGEVNDSYADAGTAFSGDNIEVLSLASEGPAYDKEGYGSSVYLDPDGVEFAKEESVMIREKVLDDPSFILKDAMVSFSKDKKTVFFSVNRKIKSKKDKNEEAVKIKSAVHLQLFKANINEKGEWVNLEMLPFNGNHFSTGQPYLNQDDTKLYFVSDGPESLGRTDIFVVDINEDGTYGTPVNLGPEINSEEREIFPFINQDNVMYFSSDVSNKKGDLDVFVSKIFDNTMSAPIKLEATVNAEKLDFQVPAVNEKENEPFLSDVQAGKRVEDLYAFAASIPVTFECQQEISGTVRNMDTQELLPNVEIILYDGNNNQLQSLLSGAGDATFSFKQSCNTTYTLKAYLNGYLTGELDIQTVNDLNAAPMEIVMHMSEAPVVETDQVAEVTEITSPEEDLSVTTAVEAASDETSNEETVAGSQYNFTSDKQVYTVQIGAFKANAETDKYSHVTGLFNHLYDDGFNRYYSGVFGSYLEAQTHRDQIKKEGYHDAFVVGLKGEERF